MNPSLLLIFNSISLNSGFIYCNISNLLGASSNYNLNLSIVFYSLFPIGMKLYYISNNFRAWNNIGYGIFNFG